MGTIRPDCIDALILWFIPALWKLNFCLGKAIGVGIGVREILNAEILAFQSGESDADQCTVNLESVEINRKRDGSMRKLTVHQRPESGEGAVEMAMSCF